jgi:hypothetical protein
MHVMIAFKLKNRVDQPSAQQSWAAKVVLAHTTDRFHGAV